MLSKTHQSKLTLMKREMGKDGDQGESSKSQRTNSPLPTTPHNSTCSQEADTDMTKFFILFWLNSSIGKGKCFLAFTVQHEITDDTGKFTIMVN